MLRTPRRIYQVITTNLQGKEREVYPLEGFVDPCRLEPKQHQHPPDDNTRLHTYDRLSAEDDDVLSRKKVDDDAEREPDVREGEPREHERDDVVLNANQIVGLSSDTHTTYQSLNVEEEHADDAVA